jgi:hypothetical protein
MRAELAWSSMAPAIARRMLGVWLSDLDCPEEIVADAVLVASELVTRSVNGGTGAPEMEVVVDDRTMRLDVVSATALIVASGVDPVDALGPVLLAALCEEWGIDTSEELTRQWALLTW